MLNVANSRPGIARVGLIVLLVILLIAGGAILMLISRMRENAMRVECEFNLKKIGTAIYLFDDQKTPDADQLLPASRIAPGYATWTVQIAPYLGADHPVQGWDLERTYFAQPAKVREAVVPAYFCPARRRDKLVSRAGDVPPGKAAHYPGALGDYACASGDGDPRHPWQTAEANGAIIPAEVLEKEDDRILSWRARTSFASLVRGKSYTILVGEKHVPVGKFGLSEFGDGSIYNGENLASSARVGGPGYPIADSPTAPFNSNFGSYHRRLCQFLMADNSVHAIDNHIDPDILGKRIRREE